MRKQAFVGALLVLLALQGFGQVVNTERIRFAPTTKQWIGHLDFNFGLNRTKAGQTIVLNTNGKLQYNHNRQKLMLLSGYGLTQFLDIDTPDAAPKNFNNAQFVHLRYNTELSQRTTMEVFVQEQWDEIHEIDMRLLLGGGPRFELLQTDSSQVFLGTLYMYEFENTSPADAFEKNRDHRLSTYLSLGFEFSNFLINHITYYQPNLEAFSDYRINAETSLHVRVDRRISLRTNFTLIYDSLPPATVRPTRYSLGSGFSVEF